MREEDRMGGEKRKKIKDGPAREKRGCRARTMEGERGINDGR